MADPKPIALTQVSAEDYDGEHAPQPFVVVGDLPGIAALVARVEALEAAAPAG